MLLANLGLLVTAFAWGSQIPLMTVLFQHWDPYFLAAVRYVLAVPVLLLILAIVEPLRGIGRALAGRRLWMLGVLLGAFVPLYSLGIAHSNPNTAAILSAAGPVVAAVVAWAGFRIPLERAMPPAIVLAAAGGALATYDRSRADDLFDLRGGELLIILASAIWACYSLAAQRWLAGWSQLRISALTLLPGAVVACGVYLVSAAVEVTPLPPPAPRDAVDVGLLAWLVLVSVVAGTLGWNYGVRHLGVVVASLYLNLIPLFAIAIATILGTPPTAMQVLGGALVLSGVMQSQLHRPPWRRRRLPTLGGSK
jgi:drug/metabolite transporter (DMT)-like permease